MKNKEIREAAKKYNIFLWQVADEIGMCDSAFSRKLRRELPNEEKEKILSIIEELAKKKQEAV